MDVLITGSTGFLGKEITRHTCDNSRVYCINRTKGDYCFNLETNIPLLNNKFDRVVHAAGKAHSIINKEIEGNKFFEVNVKGTENLLRGLEFAGIPKEFVFISSVAVYGKEFGCNIAETEVLDAKDPYGASKIKAEQIVIEWCLKNKVICTILRPPLLVGKKPPGNLGAMIKAIKKGYYFNIGGGISRKSMVLSEDVARFIPKIAPIGGIYNLTDGEHPTFKELSSAIAKKRVFNLPLKIAIIMGLAGDLIGNKSPINSFKIKKITSDLTFDDSKAREMGWDPQSVLEYLKKNDL